MAFGLIKNTTAYKIFANDKDSGTLSHAVLLVCDDSFMLKKYLKIFASALMCDNNAPCFNCRTCRLIDAENFQDVVFYPTAKKLVVSDVSDLISKSYVKPLEKDKKLFVISDMQEANAQSQNKLLKILEEPPENTYLLLGTTSTYPLLSTILSRVKRLDIPHFSDDEIFDELKGEYPDTNRLKTAIKLSGGKVGEVKNRYESGVGEDVEDLVLEIFNGIKTSRDVAKYSYKINKENIQDFIVITSKLISEVTAIKSNSKKAKDKKLDYIVENYSFGALVFILEKLRDAEKSLAFNGNTTAIADGILFGLVEGKNKWSK